MYTRSSEEGIAVAIAAVQDVHSGSFDIDDAYEPMRLVTDEY